MERRLLVVGARPHSLGMHVAQVASQLDWLVTTAGQHDEDRELDVDKPSTIHEVMQEEQPHSVVCTVGVNTGPTNSLSSAWTRSLVREMEVNYVGPMRVLQAWAKFWMRASEQTELLSAPFHFAAISSNSARVARSKSAAYCASKAALSMGLRCVAREHADTNFTIYGYEPGWIDGTPQSVRIAEKFSHDADGELIDAREVMPKLHRIPGDRVLNPVSLAHLIVSNLKSDRRYLNGTIIRLDGGEQ